MFKQINTNMINSTIQLNYPNISTVSYKPSELKQKNI